MSSAPKDSPRAHILVVEDSSVFREMQGLLLGQAGYAASSHERATEALEAAARRHFDLVVIDYELPDMNGQQFMHALRKIQPEIAVVFVSGSLTLELAIQLTSQGVAGIFHKPANPKTLLEKIDETLARNAIRDTAARTGSNSPLSPTARRTGTVVATAPAAEPAADRLAYVPRFLLGRSEAFREFTHRLWKVRDFRAVLLLQGEPGSPFDLIARDLADISIFRAGPIMECSADNFEPLGLIEVLAPSLLSHDAGTLVVTGVERFDAAQQKTLEQLITGRDVFLPFARRFRLVLAATQSLSDLVDDGRFDETLYYKISSLTLTVPPLRTMRGDIAANAEHLLSAQREADPSVSPARFTAEATEWLEAQDWPGNYQQLSATVLAAAQGADSAEISPALLQAAYEGATNPGPSRTPGQIARLPGTSDDDETRPPFPLASDLAAEALRAAARQPATVLEPRSSSAGALSFSGKTKSPTPAAPAVLTAKSLFRPSSGSYSFPQQIAHALEIAEAGRPT